MSDKLPRCPKCKQKTVTVVESCFPITPREVCYECETKMKGSKPKKKRNRRDATLRNITALKKRVARLEKQVKGLFKAAKEAGYREAVLAYQKDMRDIARRYEK